MKLNKKIIILQKNNLQVSIYQGKIVSIYKNGKEYFHGGSKPPSLKDAADFKGWDKSEIVMFPIIGPVKNFKLNYTRENNNSNTYLDQHGLTRNFPFEIVGQETDNLKLVQKYQANTIIHNAKYTPGSKRPKELSWPFSYALEKEIRVDSDKVKVIFTIINNSEKVMPYMLGWHPAFKVSHFGKVIVNEQTFSLDEIIIASQKMALFIPKCNTITYFDQNHLGEKQFGIKVSSSGYGKAMLWCPSKDAGMCCIEPVTNFPCIEKSEDYLASPELEQLNPGEKKVYVVIIEPLTINSSYSQFNKTYK